MDTYDIPVADLLLDVRNPRHDPVNTQEEQIAALVKDDQVKSLATDIAMNGLSPIEKPIVIYDDNAEKYIVLEYLLGRREVTAYTSSIGKSYQDETGHGFFIPIYPQFDTERGKTGGRLGIHPDGGKPGTLGCIGIKANAKAFHNAIRSTSSSAVLSLYVSK